MNRDPESLPEIRDALYRQRDEANDLLELEELEFYEHLSDKHKKELKKAYDYIGEAYTTCDVCGYAVENMSKETPNEQR